jgi:tetratricopeptide (TPR) repeat protein
LVYWETPYRKKRRRTRIILLVVGLFLAASLYLLVGGPGSTSLREPLRNLLNPVPVFHHMVISHNGTEKRLFPEQTLHAHPNDRLRIVEVDTSVPFNRGIRLFSQGFDVNALQQERTLAALLPGQDIFHHYTYTIQVKHKNEVIGELSLTIAPLTEDWLERANRIIDANKRIAFLESAVEENPDDMRLKLRLADEYLAQKRWKQGAQLLEEILKTKDELSLMRKLVEAYEHLRRYDQVITTLQKILAKIPDDMELRLRLAELLEKKGRTKEAIGEYTRMLPRLTKTEQIVVMKNIGYLSFQIGRKKDALDWYLKAAKYDKNDPNLYYNIGSIYDELKKPELAEKYLRVALELRKGDIEGRLRLAHSLFKKGKLKEAEKYTKEILAQDPEHLEALTIYANILEKGGNKKALRTVYEKILAHAKKNTTILFNLGVLEAEEGNAAKSIAYFERILAINPRDIETREALFDVCQRFNKDELAYAQALELIKARPEKIAVYRYIFDYLMARKKFDEAAEYMRRGVDANPKNYELRQYLILAYLRAKKPEHAEKAMEQALDLQPKDTKLLHQLARIKENKGELENAFELYKRILKISPNDEKAAEAYLRLRLKLLSKGKRVSECWYLAAKC